MVDKKNERVVELIPTYKDLNVENTLTYTLLKQEFMILAY